MSPFVWPPQEPELCGALLVAAAAYTLYHHLGAAALWTRRAAAAGWSEDDAQELGVHAQRMSGALLLGLPALALGAWLPGGLSAHGFGLRAPGGAPELWLGVALLGALLLTILWTSAARPEQQAQYPQIRRRTWSRRTLLANAASWALYLAAYELFFRGLLLGALTPVLGAWGGISAVTLAYVLAHLPKELGECLACVPMGLVFGALALATGGALLPFALHLAIALTSGHFTRIRAAKSALTSAHGDQQESAVPVLAET